MESSDVTSVRLPAPRHAGALHRRINIALAGVVAAATPVIAQGAGPDDPSPHSDLSIVTDLRAVHAAQRFTVALRVRLDPGWHTYWINGGDAGLPLSASWTLPRGAKAGAAQFPTPGLMPEPPLMAYGYVGEVLYLVDLEAPRDLVAGQQIRLTAAVDWLACAEICLPARGDVSLTLPVATDAAEHVDARARAIIESARARLPRPSADWVVSARTSAAGYRVAFVPPKGAHALLPAPYFFVDTIGVVDNAKAQLVSRSGDTLFVELPRSEFSGGDVPALNGVLVGDRRSAGGIGWRITSRVDAARTAATSADMGVMLALGLAFLGGLLLNLMPCVFPVLSIKVLALVGHGDADRRANTRHGLAFTAGVLVTFWILAAALIALRTAGERLGWGFQMQSPPVVAVLAAIMFGLALNLSGLFELGLALTRLGGVGSGRRLGDSFATGSLAAVVSTPCTAPFMGAAMGFALVQPALVGMLVFTSLALGLAAPYLLLTSAPALLRHIPKPGPWLETFKQALAFPLYATTVWLLWVFGRQMGMDAVAVLLLALIGVALGGWLWGGRQRAGARFGLVPLMGMGFAVFALAAATRLPAVPAAEQVTAGWERYSAARLAALRQEGRPVFIDFTAAWCLSCQVNERVALKSDAVRQAFGKANVVLLRADWTSRDSEITVALASYGRSGVPLYVFYPSGAARVARVLPAVLTPSMVVAAIEAGTADSGGPPQR